MWMVTVLVGQALACANSLVPASDLLNQHFTACQDCTYPMALPAEPGVYQTASLLVSPGEYDYELRWLTAAEWALDLNLTFAVPCLDIGSDIDWCTEVGADQPYYPYQADCTLYEKDTSGTFNSPVWEGLDAQGAQPFWVLISARVYNQSLPVQLDFCLVAATDQTWYIVGFSALGAVCLSLVLVIICLCCKRTEETTPLLPDAAKGAKVAKTIN